TVQHDLDDNWIHKSDSDETSCQQPSMRLRASTEETLFSKSRTGGAGTGASPGTAGLGPAVRVQERHLQAASCCSKQQIVSCRRESEIQSESQSFTFSAHNQNKEEELSAPSSTALQRNRKSSGPMQLRRAYDPLCPNIRSQISWSGSAGRTGPLMEALSCQLIRSTCSPLCPQQGVGPQLSSDQMMNHQKEPNAKLKTDRFRRGKDLLSSGWQDWRCHDKELSPGGPDRCEGGVADQETVQDNTDKTSHKHC
ncbi:hypothetical protein ATANTOWER_022581, partial [Ataeniobius toweri]|nr:hypothetical protein [Ataeniobius toweri]